MKVSRADAKAIKQAWDTTRDVTTWDGWAVFTACYPEFAHQWDLFKFTAGAARRQFDAVVSKLVEQSEPPLPRYIIPEGTTLICTVCGRWANRWVECDTQDRCPKGIRSKELDR